MSAVERTEGRDGKEGGGRRELSKPTKVINDLGSVQQHTAGATAAKKQPMHTKQRSPSVLHSEKTAAERQEAAMSEAVL